MTGTKQEQDEEFMHVFQMAAREFFLENNMTYPSQYRKYTMLSHFHCLESFHIVT